VEALEAKQVVKPGAETPAPERVKVPAEKPAPVKKKWKFIKLHGVAQELRFKDGSSFKFRLIKLNDGSGYATTSVVETEDKTLADNLKALEKTGDYGVKEIK
jgi:hypothetical protein